MSKILEKLHVGGHKKEDDAARHGHGAGQVQETRPTGGGEHGMYTTGHGYEEDPLKVSAPPAGGAGYQEYGSATAPTAGYGKPEDYYGQPPRQQQQQGGPVEKIKKKVKGKMGGKDEGSSSSSESDGQGGRRKKKHGIF